jgi:phenylpropionate dioxygenase-like ring-hydroxylating dioxygenase large terminal subunit
MFIPDNTVGYACIRHSPGYRKSKDHFHGFLSARRELRIVQRKNIFPHVAVYLSYVWDESKLRQGAGAHLHQVEIEDEKVVQQVQKGIRSRFYRPGRYAAKMEKGTHHFHRLLASFLKEE